MSKAFEKYIIMMYVCMFLSKFLDRWSIVTASWVHMSSQCEFLNLGL